MKKALTALTSLAAAAGVLWAGTPAQAAAQASQSAESTARPYVRVTYPKVVARGGAATYTIRATGLRSAYGETIAMVSYLPKNLGSVRIIQRPRNASCGFRASKWAVYCVVPLRGQSSSQWKFRLHWKYRYAGPYRVDTYARIVSLGGGSGWAYASRVTKSDLIGRAHSRILRY